MSSDQPPDSLDDKPRLFVEGLADEHAITHLLMRHGIFAHAMHGRVLAREKFPEVQVVIEFVESKKSPSGGKELLLRGIRSRISRPKSSAIGFVLDADSFQFTKWGLARTWQAIRDHLAAEPAKIQTPASIPSAGFIAYHQGIEVHPPRIGVWIMPDNQQDARLEEFLEELREQSHPLIAHAQEATRAAKDSCHAQFEEKDFKKAELAAWLAWQRQPGLSYGQALKEKYFQRHDAELANHFVAWVKRLIDEAPSL